MTGAPADAESGVDRLLDRLDLLPEFIRKDKVIVQLMRLAYLEGQKDTWQEVIDRGANAPADANEVEVEDILQQGETQSVQ